METGGVFAYPLDDSYIHMAVAKNLAMHGVWGVHPAEFCSSSSSPLWTLLLAACFKVLGVREWIPLLLNVAASLLVILSVDFMMRELRLTRRVRCYVLVTVVLVAPLPALTLLGMEHTAHALATLWLLRLSSQLAAPGPLSSRRVLAASLSAAATVLLRLEGLFAVLAVCGMLLWKRRLLPAGLIALGGGAPLLGFALFSYLQGGYVLPNPVLSKGNLPDLTSLEGAVMTFGGHMVKALFNSISLSLVCLLAVLAALLKRCPNRGPESTEPRFLALAVGLAILLHLQFAKVGWLFRYEAYLVVAGVVAAVSLIDLPGPRPGEGWGSLLRSLQRASPPLRAGACCLGAILLITYGARAGQSAATAALSMRDRYLEHVLPARFVAEYYPARTVVVNDIGAMAFYSRSRFLDLYAIGSTKPLTWILEKRDLQKACSEWIRKSDARIAVLQTERSWVAGALPSQWVHVADWKVPRNVMFHDHVVGLYARDENEAKLLRERMSRFRRSLPSEALDKIDFTFVPRPPSS